jgi:hypothetical protein
MGWISKILRIFRQPQRELVRTVLTPGEGRTKLDKRNVVTQGTQSAEESLHAFDPLTRSVANFHRDRSNASIVGSKTYIWRSSCDGDVCEGCRKMQGKQLAWNKAPDCGHPGTFFCDSGKPCRCYAEAVIPL